ncbi:MAG: 16S rRNA (cytidine(1402)-2'-O)-methyltransferase [Rhodospirillaceae bacterium]
MEQAAHENTDRREKATLYVVATPIGNLGDVTLRALDVLKTVDVIAAEDTRITTRLLDHYGIHRKLIALHEHNERRRVEQVLGLLSTGASIALVTDAGTPAISDPGVHVVAAVREAGYAVVPVPGANAAIAALSASGLPVTHFLFYGFLPARRGERAKALQGLRAAPYPLVFYEAPHRIVESTRDMCEAFGRDRSVILARELTKRFETIHACTLGTAGEWLEGDPHRVLGEFVVIVSGIEPHGATSGDEARRALEVLLSELPLKQAVALAARLTGGKRNELYDMALAMKGD